MEGILQKIERILSARGFRSPSSRSLLAMQIVIASVSVIFGIFCLPFSRWGVAFALGSFLVTCNLWWLTRSIEWSLKHGFSSGLALVATLSFLVRLAVMALVLYGALVWFVLPVVPLLAGLSSVVASLSVRGVVLLSRTTVKEI